MRQMDFFEEMIIDNFAGGGGASTGIELATGRAVDAAINHDPDAILMHQTNHPQTRHYCESVWDVDPWEVTRGRPVGLAWFSPDCKHFSKAKGSKPVDRNIRGLAWIVLKWAGTVKPRVIILENVEEFQTWGPVRKGKPVKSRRGETFRKWKEQLQALGYEIDHRELVAADYGAPTIRKRFFLIARCDGKKIIWPQRTHAPKDSEEVKNGKCKPWRGAAEIIDWTIPCPSIFDTTDEIKEKYGIRAVRPLAVNTQKRIARGIEKFVLQNKEPFIVPIGYGERKGQAPMVHDIKEPLSTVVGSGKQYLVMPSLIQYHTEQSERVRGQGMDKPIMTLDARDRYGLSVAYLTEYFQNGRPLDVNSPLHTSTTKDRECLCIAHMEKFFSGGYTGNGSDANTPLGTVTAVDHNGLVETFISKFYKTGTGQKLDEPLHTVTTSAGHFGIVTVKMSRQEMNLQHWNEVRELLNAYCGYAIAEDEILLLDVNGTMYFISDIGLRMLTPRELYAANGFPPDYIIDHDYTGKAYGKTKQVARCGNAVPPPFAEALVRANLPEMCGKQFETMKELYGVICGQAIDWSDEHDA